MQNLARSCVYDHRGIGSRVYRPGEYRKYVEDANNGHRREPKTDHRVEFLLCPNWFVCRTQIMSSIMLSRNEAFAKAGNKEKVEIRLVE